MKKTAVLLALLTVLSVLGVCTAGASIYNASDEVILTELPIYGDLRAATGLQLETQTQWNHTLFWNTAVSFPALHDARTEFRYTTHPESQPVQAEAPVLHVSSSPSDAAVLNALMKQLADRTPSGEANAQTILLADYLNRYPLQFQLVQTNTVSGGTEYLPVSADSYLNIPLLGTETATISLQKDDFGQIAASRIDHVDGSVSSTSSSGMSTSIQGTSVPTSDYYAPSVYSACTDSTLYFVMESKSQHGTVMDFSGLPEGYGIFSLPLVWDGTVYQPVPEGMDMVYSLNPQADVRNLFVTTDQSKLVLETFENGHLTLTVLDLATMTPTQILELEALADPSDAVLLHHGGTYLVYEFYEPLRLMVVSQQPDGTFQIDFLCEEPKFGPYAVDHYHDVFAYDGTRVAMAGGVNSSLPEVCFGIRDKCGFLLSIYDRQGLQYFGGFLTSVSSNQPDDRNAPTANEPFLTLSWETEESS